MRDVARLAGVSVPTVSAVINGKGRVRPELARRVLRAIESIDYHPNQLARSLRMQRTQIIAVIMPQIASPFFTEVLRGAEDVARGTGHSILIADSGANPEEESRELSAFLTRQVDGVLLASANPSFDFQPLIRKRSPFVLFDRVPAGYCGPAVVTTNAESAFEATRHLIGLGHERIGIITGRQGISTAIERVEGFRKAMGDAGLPVRSEYVRCGEFRLEEGYRCAMALMKLVEPPTAIFSCNYEMTLGLVRALSELRVACPAQVSVLGFDDFVVGMDGFSWATLFSPQLTTVAQPSYEIGKTAVRLLLSRIERSGQPPPEEPGEAGFVRLKCELKIRESTAPPLRR